MTRKPGHCIFFRGMMEQGQDVIIIGAGICGLSMAEKLAGSGKKVLILEALGRAGGRIHTVSSGDFTIEEGAEFIHGNLPLTNTLVKKAGARAVKFEGGIYRSKYGSVYPADDFVPHMKRVIKAFKELFKDMTLAEFLGTHFNQEDDKELREAVIRQAEGFDVADPARVSVFALRDEWSRGHEETYIIKEGYGALVRYLKVACEKKGCRFHFSKEVSRVEWKQNEAAITCTDDSRYTASKVIITVPLGILASVQGNRGHIEFDPPVPHLIHAAREMGFGTVVKAVLAFKNRFWQDRDFEIYCRQIPDLGFLVNGTAFPVFWQGITGTGIAILTGWAGGPCAQKLLHYNDEELKETALFSLAHALMCKQEFLKAQLLDVNVFNWSRHPFVRGAYSYATPATAAAKKLFAEPLLDTVYFAGEAFGNEMGTVEAALQSAEDVLKRIS